MQQRYRHRQRPNDQGNRPPAGPHAPSYIDRYHVPVLTVSIKLLITIHPFDIAAARRRSDLPASLLYMII